MDHRSGFATMAALGLALLPSTLLAQQPQQPPSRQQKPAKELILGSWALLLIDGVKEDGTHVPLYGPNPEGMFIVGPEGHFSINVMRSGRAPFASNNRLAGTDAENRATVQGSFAYFGRYMLDDGGKTINLHIEASAFPNFEGANQKRDITAITDEILTFNFEPAEPGYTHGEAVWKKLK